MHFKLDVKGHIPPPPPKKSLGQEVNDLFLPRLFPQELDCGQNSLKIKDLNLPRPGNFFGPHLQILPPSLVS